MSDIANGKVTLKKGPNRAGATPLFGGQSAQKFVGSLPPVMQETGPSSSWGQESENASCNLNNA